VLPALTAPRRRIAARRLVAGAGGAVLAVAAIFTQLSSSPAPPDGPSLAQSLAPSTWAMAVPSAWLAAPAPRVRSGDLIDVLAVRQGDRAYAVPVAYAARVMAIDDRGIVLELDEEGASAIAIARGGGLLLVPLLRSTR
jgi:hypothetical protein